MKKYIISISKHPLLSGSLIMILGSNLVNLLSYIYHLMMGRMLGPVNYGELAALFSLMGLIGMIPGSVGLTIIKFVSGSNSTEKTKELIIWFTRRSLIVGVGMSVLMLVLSPLISNFLRIENNFYIILIGLTFLFSFPAFINRSILQGLIKFKESVTSVILENISKVFLGGILVYIGFSVSGALFALLISVIIGLLSSRSYLKEYLVNKIVSQVNFKPMIIYTLPVLIQSIATTSLYSTDLLLVKHFFPAHEAGIYAAISTLGKIIFFATGPIGSVMFPLVSRKKSNGEDYKEVVSYSLLLTLCCSLLILAFYYLFPDLVVGILYGDLYSDSIQYVFWMGLVMTLYTLSNILLSFCLSINQLKVVFFPIFAAGAQIIGILMFHKNLYEVIYVSMSVSLLLLISLGIYSNHSINLRNVVSGRYINK